ncbi:MAG: hypothetical protein Q4E05_08325, partial [Pseudoclavibacter sp.]|nr:hypothetical protein [Pseudoclavibacter sp.]
GPPAPAGGRKKRRRGAATPPRPRRTRTAARKGTIERFAGDRVLRNNDQRNLVIALALEYDGVSADPGHFETAYERMGWRAPADPAGSLRRTERAGWLDRGPGNTRIPSAAGRAWHADGQAPPEA